MRWIVRVYALIPGKSRFSESPSTSSTEVPTSPTWLVLEEFFQGAWIQKFPGGGVEPYEGLEEALARELKEELNAEIRTLEHFYTTHFFQRSYYHEDARVLPIYYLVRLAGEPQVTSPRIRLRWLRADYLQLTFPVDRYVGRLLLRQNPPLRCASPLRTELSNRGH